jgi:2-haloacid dehalogenase
MSITTCIFDAYGTLFDVTAAARAAAAQPQNSSISENWPKLATDWRLKQLQYTWIRAITGAHVDFWQVTQEGLDWAMEANGVGGAELRAELLELYWNLEAYGEVPNMLKTLKAAGLQTAILSNGSPDMLTGAVSSAGIGGQLDALLSVESIGFFKPNRKVYDLVGAHFGCHLDEVLFVSSNGWDAASAVGYGFTTVWVNRACEPMDRLPWKPHHQLSDLQQIPLIAGVSL